MYRMNEKPFKFREMKRINAAECTKLPTKFDAKRSFFILTIKLKYLLTLHDAESRRLLVATLGFPIKLITSQGKFKLRPPFFQLLQLSELHKTMFFGIHTEFSILRCVLNCLRATQRFATLV